MNKHSAMNKKKNVKITKQ